MVLTSVNDLGMASHGKGGSLPSSSGSRRMDVKATSSRMTLKRNGVIKNLGVERCGGRCMMRKSALREYKNIGILVRKEEMKSGKHHE